MEKGTILTRVGDNHSEDTRLRPLGGLWEKKLETKSTSNSGLKPKKRKGWQ